MKKLGLLLIAVAFIFTSCNNDDDSSSQDPLIGSWNYFKYFENGVEQPLFPCEAEGTLVVSANGTYVFTYFTENVDGDCVQDGDVEVGTWENIGNGNYIMGFEGAQITQQIFFEGNTFYFENVDGEITYRDVYIRN